MSVVLAFVVFLLLLPLWLPICFVLVAWDIGKFFSEELIREMRK